MNLRENVRAILHYESFDHMPVVHFGYWPETLEKWCREGHLTAEEIEITGTAALRTSGWPKRWASTTAGSPPPE